jgi:hypothetical protein
MNVGSGSRGRALLASKCGEPKHLGSEILRLTFASQLWIERLFAFIADATER